MSTAEVEVPTQLAEHLDEYEIDDEETFDSAKRKAIVEYHPDQGGDTEVFRRINEAAETIEGALEREEKVRAVPEEQTEAASSHGSEPRYAGAIDWDTMLEDNLESGLHQHSESTAENLGYNVISTNFGQQNMSGAATVEEAVGDLKIGVELDVDGEHMHMEAAYFTDADGLLGTEGGTAHYDEAEDRLDEDDPKATAVFESQLEMMGEYLSLRAEEEYL